MWEGWSGLDRKLKEEPAEVVNGVGGMREREREASVEARGFWRGRC